MIQEERDPLTLPPLRDDLGYFARIYLALMVVVTLPVTWFVVANGGLRL